MPLFPLLWLFFCYSFLGWVLETAVSAVRLHRYVDRSVLFGPLCACYGITAVLLTVGLPELRGNYFFLFLGSAICSTVVEWIAGHLLEKATHTRWWDYSNRRGNLDGYICVGSFLLWGVLGLAAVQWINPLLLALYRWLPPLVGEILLWVLLGGIFFGAVTDFGALYASVKNDGKSMGMLIEKYIGKTGRKLFLLFCWLFCGIVIAAFADMVAGTFNAYGADGALVEAAQTNGAAGMVSIMFMVFAVIFGLLQKNMHFTGWKENVISIVFIVLSFVVGANFPIILGKAAWSYITFVYIFFAAVLPMWLLKQPRDHMTTFMFVAMIVGAVLGLIVNHPVMNLPVFTGFTNAKLGTMFPILFVTVACGAVSGFHSLVSSGTSSKTVTNEKDMLKVGYGAMVLESLLAVIALCVAGASAAADGTPADGTPFQVFSRGVASFFVGFGLDQHFASVFMTMCVSALALTSLDAVARIGRMSFQELFSVDDMEHAEGWRKLLCNVYFSTFLTLAFGFLLTKIGYANIWPLFGSANQLLSALVLATLCVFLKVTGRSNKMIFPPLIIMLCVTFTALVQRLIAMVKAISNAAAVTIPAGETTWGAVFIANGLQLILAVLLIVLGLNIVFHSFKAYKNAEHNSEAKV